MSSSAFKFKFILISVTALWLVSAVVYAKEQVGDVHSAQPVLSNTSKGNASTQTISRQSVTSKKTALTKDPIHKQSRHKQSQDGVDRGLAKKTTFLNSNPASTDLEISPGMDGFIATWLHLKPGPLPAYIKDKPGKLKTHDPLKIATLSKAPREGAPGLGGRWKVNAQASKRFDLRGRKASLDYLSGLIRVDRAQKVLFSVGSNANYELWVNGEQIASRGFKRKARPDTDLITLNLAKGDNLVVIRVWKKRALKKYFYFRLMNQSFQRPRDVSWVLPGASDQLNHVLAFSSKLTMDREVDLQAAGIQTRLWLDFPGGMPVTKPITVTVDVKRAKPQKPLTFKLDFKKGALPFKLLKTYHFVGKDMPWKVIVKLGVKRHIMPFGFRLNDIHNLAKAHKLYQHYMNAVDQNAELGLSVPTSSVESVAWILEHLQRLIESGDGDNRYLAREIKNVTRMADALSRGKDPFFGKKGGLQRRGYRSQLDGKLHRYALYVPPAWKEEGTRRFGLVVLLHGLRGHPVKSLTVMFGNPLEEDEDRQHRARHPMPLRAAPMFVVAPEGFGSSGYYAYGERDVLDVIEQVAQRYRIDPNRIYVTGASMGGIGSASLPFHYPDKFAASAPLCGYHSVHTYSSMAGIKLQPFESFPVDYRSNAAWAENGVHLPLYLIHGGKDRPINSIVLKKRYEALGYKVRFDLHENLGHNVWDEAYKDRRIFQHFKQFKRDPNPRKVILKTGNLRFNKSHWIVLEDVQKFDQFSQITAQWQMDNKVSVTTQNVKAFTVLDDKMLSNGKTPKVEVDGQAVVLGEKQLFGKDLDEKPAQKQLLTKKQNGGWVLYKEGKTWKSGKSGLARHSGKLRKKPGLSGPMGEHLFESLLFVYGTQTSAEATLGKRLAEKLRYPRGTTSIEWPVKADVQVTQKDIEEKTLVLIGTFSGNSLLAKIKKQLPIHATGQTLTVGRKKYTGDTITAAYIYPNPLNPQKYVMIYTGTSLNGLFYADHLPEILPDYMVFDGAKWHKKGGHVTGDRPVLQAGFFNKFWDLD